MLDYKLLEAFAMVVKEGGFEKAAQKLGLTQSAVSQRVRALEDQTGQILLVRSLPPETTTSGKNLLKHYHQVKLLEDNLFQESGRPLGDVRTRLTMALNADSLATWFLDAVADILMKDKILLDIRVDDQEQTHQLLRDGDVVGCVSTLKTPLQGCRIEYLGCMEYQLLANSAFKEKWFGEEVTRENILDAPALVFNRKDELHGKLMKQLFDKTPKLDYINYLPSAEQFADFIIRGLGYGMLPRLQVESFIESGLLVDLAPGLRVDVHLYWHCWNLKSSLLNEFSEDFITRAKAILGR